MDRHYQAPEAEIICFESNGIIATSPYTNPEAPENWGWGEEHEL